MEQKEVRQQPIFTLTREQFNEVLLAVKWVAMSQNEINERQKYIDEAKRFWIDKRTIKAELFEIPVVKWSLNLIPKMRPITIEMIQDYITGLVYFPHSLKNEKLKPLAERLTKPAWDKIMEFALSDYHRNHLINEIVNEKDTITISMFPSGFDTISTREALKGFIKDKIIYPSERNLDVLKVKFKLNQEQKFKHLYLDLGGTEETISLQTQNPYPEIFSNLESWNLFKDYLSEANQSEIIREASFIYRMMSEQEKPPLIHSHIKPGMFKCWFNDHLEELNSEYLSETKTFNYCVIDHREKRYNKLRNLSFKSNSTKKIITD